eukprot:4834529-Karenia_brevis.AAC.1
MFGLSSESTPEEVDKATRAVRRLAKLHKEIEENTETINTYLALRKMGFGNVNKDMILRSKKKQGVKQSLKKQVLIFSKAQCPGLAGKLDP